MKKEDSFSKLKNKFSDDNELERKKELIKVLDTKNGEELSKLFLKSDVILLAGVFENFVKVSTKVNDVIPLWCISLPGYTYPCSLNYTDIKLQTLQDKDLILLIENNIRGGISIIMGGHYVKSNENIEITYMDATNMFVYSMSEMLPYDKIEMWHGPPDLLMNKLDENLNTPDDNDNGFFVEVDLKYPIIMKEKTINFQLLLRT